MKVCECGCGQPNNGRGRYRWGHRPKETLRAVNTACACGCGEMLSNEKQRLYDNTMYIQGHDRRGKPSGRRYIPQPDEIPSGKCECGCGQQTEIVTRTFRKWRHFAGHPKPYVVGHHLHRMKGIPKQNPKPKPNRITENGYILALAPDHPNAPKDGYMLEHRLVWEQAHGELLDRTMHVHHINGIRDDNRPENLVALTRSEHRKLHAVGRTEKRRTQNQHQN